MHLSHDISSPAAVPIDFAQFLAVDVRVGRIVTAAPLVGARRSTIKLTIDFGATIGIKRSVAQITEHYRADDLPGRRVAAVVNLPLRQIGQTVSEVLTLGSADDAGAVVLFAPDVAVPLGGRLF